MTMLQDLLGVVNIDGSYWSLAIEITFYFLISVILAYKLLPHIDWFLAAWLCYAALPHLPYAGPLFTTLFIRGYAPSFIAGMLFYLMQQPQGRTWWHYLLLIGAYALAVKSSMQNATDISSHYHLLMSPMVAAALVTSFFLLFFLIIFRRLNLARFTWLTWLGALTYPLYLVHSDIGFIIFHCARATWNKYLLVSLVLLVMLVLAYMIHTQVEKRYTKRLGT